MPELLLSCQDLSKAFGGPPLFEGLSFGIFEGDHAGLVGPNGSGKTTLLRILAGLDEPTSGSRAVRKRLRLGYVPQDPRFAPDTTVESVLREAVLEAGHDEDDADGRVAVAIGRAGFTDGAQPTATLSGGWRKRLVIASALAREPQLILLDEPTNHLDLKGILWLEELMAREPEAFLAVSHDRYFLEAVAGRVIELNRLFPSGILDVQGSYSRYLEKKDELLAGQAAYQDSLRNRVRGELLWLSRKARARTRKAQARIDEAGRLEEELSDLEARTRAGGVAIDFSGTDRRTRRLLVAEGLHKSFGDRAVVRDLDLTLSPGMRLGLLGANGSGKTTLLRMLAGLEAPDAGRLQPAPNLRVVMFDQHRARLEAGLSLRRALAPAGDSVVFQGRSIHVAGWARRFLFRAEQLDQPVERLSGGEQARVVIARLMLEPADVLLLDEPTNDLDIPTLEVLEESLLEFPGALVLVTHDRYLLDRVSTRILALDADGTGAGVAVEFADYAQWESTERARDEDSRSRAAAGAPPPARGSATRSAVRPRKLAYLEQREWDQMETLILEAEERLATCQRAVQDPGVVSDHEALAGRLASLEEAQSVVDRLYARWAELEGKLRVTD
jgi:ATP-binding cassette subfamily F protein uup